MVDINRQSNSIYSLEILARWHTGPLEGLSAKASICVFTHHASSLEDL